MAAGGAAGGAGGAGVRVGRGRGVRVGVALRLGRRGVAVGVGDGRTSVGRVMRIGSTGAGARGVRSQSSASAVPATARMASTNARPRRGFTPVRLPHRGGVSMRGA